MNECMKIIRKCFETQRELWNDKTRWIYKFNYHKYYFMIWFKISELVKLGEVISENKS